MSQLLPVTQADRDAVQAFHRIMAARIMSDIASERPKLGEDEGDAGTLVQAFARHRIAHSPSRGGEVEKLREALERIAINSNIDWDQARKHPAKQIDVVHSLAVDAFYGVAALASPPLVGASCGLCGNGPHDPDCPDHPVYDTLKDRA